MRAGIRRNSPANPGFAELDTMTGTPELFVHGRRHARRKRLFVQLIATIALVLSIAVAVTAVSLGARAEMSDTQH
jgi:t-SNARE complex subunit (syntaxin)